MRAWTFTGLSKCKVTSLPGMEGDPPSGNAHRKYLSIKRIPAEQGALCGVNPKFKI